MGNDILEATLVNSDEGPEPSPQSKPRIRPANEVENDQNIDRTDGSGAMITKTDTGQIVISGRVKKAAIVSDEPDDVEDADDAFDDPGHSDDSAMDGDSSDIPWGGDPEPSRAQVQGSGGRGAGQRSQDTASGQMESRKERFDAERRSKSQHTSSNDEDDSPFDMNQLAVVGVVLLLLIAGIYFLVIPNDDETDYVVTVPGLRVGDEGRYNVDGYIEIKNAGSDPIAGEIKEGRIDLDKSSMVVKAEGISTVTDGYYHEYSALETYTLNTWDIEGWVDTVSYGVLDLDGQVTVTSNAFRNGNTILLTDMEADTDASAESRDIGFYSKQIQSEDTLRTYSSDAGDLQSSFDDVIRKPGLKKGMSGRFENDDIEYEWTVTGNTKVFKTECVIVSIKVLKPTDEDVESQSIKLYLSNNHPFPVKTAFEIVFVGQGRVTVKYTTTMNHFKLGTSEIIIPEDEIVKESPYDDPRTMREYPQTGPSANSSISFHVEDAQDKALEDSGLQDYFNSHSGAYLVQGIYNETDGPVWNLTYSYPGSESGYVVLVTQSRVTDKGEMKLGDVGYLLEVNDPPADFINSWGGAEEILKQDDEVKAECFDGSEHLNLHDCNFAVRTRLYQPSIDFVSMFASAPRVEYGFTVTKDDEFAAGVDAETGQLLFVATHDGPALF
jgi:hypothetical protein